MLKTALVAMTVLGCDCDAKMCEYIRATPPEWSTMAECEAALKSRAVRDSDLGYPTVVAICRSTQESPARLAATPAIDATQTASTQPAAPVEIASSAESRSIMVRAADKYVVARNAVAGVAGGTVEFVGGVAYGTVDTIGRVARGTVNAVGNGVGWAYGKVASAF